MDFVHGKKQEETERERKGTKRNGNKQTNKKTERTPMCNIFTLEIKPCGLGSRIRDVCSPKIGLNFFSEVGG